MGKEPGRWCGLQGQATRVTSLEKKAALTGAALLSRSATPHLVSDIRPQHPGLLTVSPARLRMLALTLKSF